MEEKRHNIMDPFLEAIKNNGDCSLDSLSPYDPTIGEENEIDYAKENAESQQKLIMLVKEALDSREIKYSFSNDSQTNLSFSLEKDNKKLDITMDVIFPSVRIRADYPFRVQSDAVVLVALLQAEINDDKYHECIRFDHHNGQLYSLLEVWAGGRHRLDAESLLGEMDYLTSKVFYEYTRLANYAVGKIGAEEKNLYERMLLEAINGLMEDDISYRSITYGSDVIMKKLLYGSCDIDSVKKWYKKLQKVADDSLPFY